MISTPEQLQRQQTMTLHEQHNPPGVEEARPQPGSTPAYFSLDATSAAKQMAALNATSQLRRASQSGGTSDTLFGPRQPHPESAYVEAWTEFNSLDSPPMFSSDATGGVAQPNRGPGPAATAQVLKSRRDEFLKFVAGVMNARQTPLPSTITGIPSAYDPATSPWKSIEPTAEPGGFRLAGKDVDLFKLWQLVLSHGGNVKVTRENGWNALLSHFGLPEELPGSQVNGNPSVARLLAQYYMALLAAFEEVYLRNMQQQKAIQARQQQQQQQQQGPMSFSSNNAADQAPVVFSGQQSEPTGLALPPSGRLQSASLTPTQATPGGLKHDQHTASPSHVSETSVASHLPPNSITTQTSTQASEMPEAFVGGERERDPHDGGSGAGSPALPQGENISGESDRRKRKLQEEESDKRVRQRTGSMATSRQGPTTSPTPSGVQLDNSSQTTGHGRLSSPSRSSSANPGQSRQSRSRRKIEYVPLARELETHGGRDLDMIDAELVKVASRRPQRSVDEWGTVDIDGLTMSLRSRIPTEVSYAITILSVLSTMRGQSPDTGFSLQQCDELLDELLDFLQEQAFGNEEDLFKDADTFWMHRELVSFVRDTELQKFSALPRIKFGAVLGHRSKPSPVDVVFAILNLFRNFSLTGENQRFMGQHPDVLGLLLRICSLSVPSPDTAQRRLPSPASHVLTLPDVVKARRDVLTIISNLVPFTTLASHAPHVRTRLFELLASFLVEPHDLSSPTGIVMQSGAISAGSVRPPLVVDLALEAFSKLAQPDANRLALSQGVKLCWLWSLFDSLVHRLPVSTDDFTITMRMHDVWLSYIEKVVLSIYSICFLASPELKTKIKTDRTLSFPKLILRMVKRFVSINQPDARQYFLVSSRRAVEALKLIDDGSDAFESPQTSGPMFAFGMGFGESDVKQMETGVGLLAAFQDDVTWNIMMMPHLDDVMFTELDSLARINV